MKPNPKKFHFECCDCKAEYPGNEVIYLCPACQKKNQPGTPPAGVLKTIYNYDKIRCHCYTKDLFGDLESRNFLPLLPLHSIKSMPNLRIGKTPLYRVDEQTTERQMDFELYLKDDSQNPTFSFKDRASALVSAFSKEHEISTIIAASTGNAGSSLAGICASQGQKALIIVPASAPLAKLTQILMYGAILLPVKGNYDDAFDLSVGISEKYGWYNRNTAYNPLTIEGKKTVSFELFSQLHRRLPDRIYIPVGDGVIFSGVCKGFEDLLSLGIIDRMPKLVAVQSAGSANLISNLKSLEFQVTPSKTIADSISVDVPKCFKMTADYLETYQGETILVTDEEIIQASGKLSQFTGIFAEPAAAAAFAGFLKHWREESIPTGSKNVVLLTGSGLKDLQSVQSAISIPGAIEPDVDSAAQFIARFNNLPG